MRLIAILALASTACVPAWAQIYKCPDAGGRTVIQQVPCAASGALVGGEIKRREVEARAKLEAEKERDKRAQAERDRELRQYAEDEAEKKATCQGKLYETPTIGMAEKAFLLCTVTGRGRASAVNQTQTAAGVTKQYVYRSEYSSGPKYVYTRNGVVAAIQH